MTKESIVIGDETLEIETRPITLVFNTSPLKSGYPNRHMIDPEWTLANYRSLVEITEATARLFKIVFPDFDLPITKASIDKCSLGHQHVVGLMALSIHFLNTRQPFGWRFPETYLHPRHQANLADALIWFALQPQKGPNNEQVDPGR